MTFVNDRYHFVAGKVTATLILLICSILAGVPASARERVEVAMVLFRGETQAEKGFRERLRSSPKYDFNFTVYNAEQSTEKLEEIVSKLDGSKYRLIYTFGTLATQRVMKKVRETPIIFNIVQRPLEAGIIKSWNGSGNNATGASNFVSMESAFRTLGLVMHIHKLGFIYYVNDPSPVYQKQDIEVQEKRFGFRKIDIPIACRETIPLALKTTIDAKPDAVMIPADAFVRAYAAEIIPTLNKHKIPTITVVPEMVRENGALMALGADYFRLGRMAAENALEVLAGKTPGELPIRTVDNLSIVINLRTADRLGINFPIQLLRLSQVLR
jgi:putative ABC transport system substrate-binding protein